MKKECIAMLLAGGQGSRLYALTSRVAKPAVPFGGKFRIIDFPLSNCANSGIDTVGVLTQYRPLELHRYIGNGQPWDLDRSDGGVHILPPYVREGGSGTWYRGTANAIYQNMDFIQQYHPDHVLVLSGDHIYKMDYAKLLRQHKKAGAACTVSVLEVPRQEASRFGILSADQTGTILEFEEKPAVPKSNLASMGIYVFRWETLRAYLTADEADGSSGHDFGGDIIPKMLAGGEKLTAFRFEGYWKDVGTIDSLWDANMDLLSVKGGVMIYDKRWPVYTRSPTRPPHVTGDKAVLSHSIVTGGCQVSGRVENSVLFHSVLVEEGAQVRYSILMPGVVVQAGARVEYAIVAEGAVIGGGAAVGAPPDGSDAWGVAVVAGGIRVAPYAVVPPGAMIQDTGKGGVQYE